MWHAQPDVSWISHGSIETFMNDFLHGCLMFAVVVIK